MKDKEILVIGCAGDGIKEISKKLLESATIAQSGSIVSIEHETVQMPRPLVEAVIEKMDDDYEINMEKLMPCLDWKKYGPPKKRKNRK